ncbi:hypothetical protein QOZ80_3BG0282760 [Eleusine coracana subsp. coracana]|nr:hypothetical protein QOZ80_3BG0282760 [Eleusine coracana subsp. coracana]
MSTTPRGRSSHRRGVRCKCAGGDRAACCFNPLRSFFRCPRRGRSRSKSKNRTPSRVRDAPTPPAGVAAQQQQGQQQEEEPSFFVYAMPNQDGAGNNKKKKKKHRKPCVPSLGSCFRSRKNKNKERKAGAADRRPALTPATSMLTHPPGSPVPVEKSSQTATPSMTQPPSPAPTENTSVVNSPAPPGRQSAATTPSRALPATPRPGKQSTDDSARSPFAPQMQQSTTDSPFAPPQMQQQSTADSAWSPFAPQQSQGPTKNMVEGIEIVEVATGERMSTHDLGLIEMVAGSSTDNSSAESSMKSSLEYVNEPPPPPLATKQITVVEREAAVATTTKATRERPVKLWLNGKTMESRARERFTEPLKAAEAEELWAHDIACSRVHASMLADTVTSFFELLPVRSLAYGI